MALSRVVRNSRGARRAIPRDPRRRGGWLCHFSPSVPALAGLALAFGLGGLAIRLFLGQQQLAQGLQVASQDAQAHVTLVTPFAPIAATLQTVAGLQGTDRRLHARMMLSRLAKGQGALLL